MKLKIKKRQTLFLLLAIGLAYAAIAAPTALGHLALLGLFEDPGGVTTAGLPDDRQVHLPTNYTNWTPPPMGMSFTDSAYGSLITRVSDGAAQFNRPVHHEYATMSPFNKDNTRILLIVPSISFYVADLRGNVIIPPAEVGVHARSEPRWSATDPNVFYFHEFESEIYKNNEIRKYDLTTRQSSVVHSFTEFSEINFGLGESDISEDGDHMVIIGDNRYVGVYTFSTDTLGPTLDILGLDGGFDYFDMTPDNNVIVRWGDSGVGRYKGFEVYDKNMNFLRQVHTGGAHADRGRDLNGDEVLVVLAATDNTPPPGCENSGVEKIRISDGKKTCLIGMNFDVGAHISANSDGRNPWVLIETIDERRGTAKPNASLPTDWQSSWRPYFNEIILVKMDGSEARRIAHHRSRQLDDYYFQPRAAISRDGAYAIFDSNFGVLPMDEYTDVFLINLKNYPATNVSAATYSGGALATEAISSAYGSEMASTTLLASTIPLPTSLSENQVLVRDTAGVDRLAPLFFVSPAQINYQIPAGTSLGPATVMVIGGNNRVSTGTTEITSVMPGLFSADASGRGAAVGYVIRVKSDGSQTYEPVATFDSTQNKIVPAPIDLGPPTDQVFLALYGTGFRYRSSLSAVSVTIGGVDAQVTYAAAQGFFVGLDQLNARLPRTLIGRGLVDVVMKADGRTANTLNVSIK